MPAEAFGPAESPSLDAELALTDSETESDDEVHKINTGDQDEGQARPNPGIQDEGQAGPNPGVQDEDQARSNPATTLTVTTTTTIPPPPPQPQQSTADPTLMKSIDELEQHMANLLQYNLALEERLDKHGSWLYKLNNLNIPYKVSKAVDEIVTDAVDWAMQAPLRARFSDLPTLSLPPPPPSTGTSRSIQQQSGKAQSPSKSVASTSYSMAWTISDTTYELAGVSRTQDLSLMDSSIQDDSIPDEQIHLFDDEDYGNDHLQKADSNVENNWATALASTYVTPAENSLLVKIRDMTNFLNWYYRQVNKTKLSQADLEGQAYEVVDWTNPERDQVSLDVKQPLPLGGPPGYVTIQTQLFFNKDLEYLRYGSKGSSLALSISKMKAASYLEFGLELLVPEQMLIEDVCTYDISAKYGISHWWFNRKKFYIDKHDSSSRRKEVKSHMQILSVIRNKAYSSYGYDYLSEIVLQRADLQEHTIAEKDFMNLHPSYEFKHDYTIIESPQTVVFSVNNNKRKIMRFNEIYKFNDGTLTWILEALAYIVKEFKATEDEKGLSEPGMICWWTSS
nr:hypothetical protein [Tanacetum cinerariifolium]